MDLNDKLTQATGTPRDYRSPYWPLPAIGTGKDTSSSIINQTILKALTSGLLPGPKGGTSGRVLSNSEAIDQALHAMYSGGMKFSGPEHRGSMSFDSQGIPRGVFEFKEPAPNMEAAAQNTDIPKGQALDPYEVALRNQILKNQYKFTDKELADLTDKLMAEPNPTYPANAAEMAKMFKLKQATNPTPLDPNKLNEMYIRNDFSGPPIDGQ